MEKFTKISSNLIPLFINDIDTDMIIPAKFLTNITSHGYSDYLFYELRKESNFILNNIDPDKYKILCTGENFGCGSSREHAVWALKDYGIKVIIAPSFSDIFYNNAMKNGLLLIQLSSKDIYSLFSKWNNEKQKVAVDLVNRKIIINNLEFIFSFNDYRRWCFINGYDDLDYLLSKENLISKFENMVRRA